MKAVKLLIVGLLAAPVVALAVDLIDFAPSTVFTPVGFDSNDNAQLVLDGTFPNTCYKVGEPVVAVDRANKRIDVVDKAYHHRSGVCLYMLVPFYKTVNLGMLNEGKYEVFVHSSQSGEVRAGELEVNKATVPTPDDHIYAPVEEATMDLSGSEPVLTLRGHFSQSCLRVKEVRVLTFTTPNNMIEVLPIVEEDGTACKEASKPFEVSTTIKNAPTGGRTLLHIRSLNGQAINRVLNM